MQTTNSQKARRLPPYAVPLFPPFLALAHPYLNCSSGVGGGGKNYATLANLKFPHATLGSLRELQTTCAGELAQAKQFVLFHEF